MFVLRDIFTFVNLLCKIHEEDLKYALRGFDPICSGMQVRVWKSLLYYHQTCAKEDPVDTTPSQKERKPRIPLHVFTEKPEGVLSLRQIRQYMKEVHNISRKKSSPGNGESMGSMLTASDRIEQRIRVDQLHTPNVERNRPSIGASERGSPGSPIISTPIRSWSTPQRDTRSEFSAPPSIVSLNFLFFKKNVLFVVCTNTLWVLAALSLREMERLYTPPSTPVSKAEYDSPAPTPTKSEAISQVCHEESKVYGQFKF